MRKIYLIFILFFTVSSFGHESQNDDLAAKIINQFVDFKLQIKNNDIYMYDAKYVSDLLKKYSVIQCEYPEVYGQLNHYSHLIIGSAYLNSGNIAEAKKHLLKSCDMSGFIIRSFGPNMVLAKKLLDFGEKQVVIDFLNRCEQFWYHQRTPYLWQEQIKNGLTPDFGANLDY